MAQAQESWLGHRDCPGKQDSSGTEQGDAKVNHGTLDLDRDAKAQIQSCGESFSVGQGADTALSGQSWVQILHFKEIVLLISTCAGLLEEIPATDSSLDYSASHLCCLTEIISLNVCNTKLMLGGSIY